MCHVLQNIVHACCVDVHVDSERGGSQHYGPLLKLYIGCLMIITEKLNVKNSMAMYFQGNKVEGPSKDYGWNVTTLWL